MPNIVPRNEGVSSPEQAPPVESRDSREARDEARKNLDWKDTTNYLDTAQDIELSSSTLYDYKFISIHHDVRDIMDAQQEEGDINVKSYEELYAGLAAGDKEIMANKNDLSERIDLLKLARLKRIKQENEYLVDAKFPKKELEDRFWAGEPLIREIQNPKTGEIKQVDLLSLVPEIKITQEEFQYYMLVIEETQVQFQMLSMFRDPAIAIHHAENSGHAQLKNINGKNMYVPVSITDAKGYSRGDILKTNSGFRAKGHVHEIGWYEENTSTLIKIEADACRIWRSDIDTSRTHEQSDPRMIANMNAMGSGEKNNSANKAEVSFHFGEGGKGRIYEAMRHHYDEKMIDTRGFGITDAEIGDKILTDIIAVAYSQNATDWLMSFAKGTGVVKQDELIRPEAVKGVGGDKGWDKKPIFIFDVKHPIGKTRFTNDDFAVDKNPFSNDGPEEKLEYGRIELVGVPALTHYIQWRISRGDVPGVLETTEIALTGITAEEEAEKDAENRRLEEESTEEEKELFAWPEEFVDGMASVMNGVFGDQAEAYVKSIIDGRPMSQITLQKEDGSDEVARIGSEDELAKFVQNRMEKAHIQSNVLRGIGGSTNRQDAAKKIFEFIKVMGSTIGGDDDLKTRRLRTDNADRLYKKLQKNK